MRIKIVILVLTISSCSTRCSNKVNDVNNVDVLLAQADENIQTRNGIVYHHDLPYSGKLFSLYNNGDTAFCGSYWNGKEHGWQKRWYENKVLAEQRYFIAGKKEGIHNAWWDNGLPRFEYHFKDDEHEGELREWYSNGKKSRMFHYKAGHEEGAQQMWWDDGSIRANYVVKDGERYGFIGQKLCKNILTSATK